MVPRTSRILFLALVATAAAGCAHDVHVSRLEGTWGGTEAGLSVRDDLAELLVPCGAGRISEPILLDRNGCFDVTGAYAVLRGTTPAEGDRGPSWMRARFTGRVEGSRLALTVHFSDSDETQSYKLTRDAAVQVPACA